MKKILTIIGAIGLTATAGSTIVACGKGNTNQENGNNGVFLDTKGFNEEQYTKTFKNLQQETNALEEELSDTADYGTIYRFELDATPENPVGLVNKKNLDENDKNNVAFENTKIQQYIIYQIQAAKIVIEMKEKGFPLNIGEGENSIEKDMLEMFKRYQEFNKLSKEILVSLKTLVSNIQESIKN